MVAYRLRCFRIVVLLAVCFTPLVGCRMAAPIHLWSPPALQSTVGHTVLVPKIVGPAEIADPIHQKLLSAAPVDEGRQTRLLATDAVSKRPSPSSDQGIALVSYDQHDESDLALAATARQQHIDFILRGEIVPDQRPRSIAEAGNQLTISWRLMPVGADRQAAAVGRSMGWPVVVDLESAIKNHPDLGWAADRDGVLQAAMVRETLPLITPTVIRQRVQLEIPYLMPGTRAIRRGNVYALAGRWAEAEAEWQSVIERYPFSSVAVHNLAIAAVAKQDFPLARQLARKAVRMKPTSLHQQTSVWVEKVQREYHRAFDLPDPSEGWSVTRSAETL